MKRRFTMIMLAAIGAAVLAPSLASAHQCEDVNDPSTCEESPVVPNWRDGNYVPLFDLADRDDEQQRKDAQRWREECEQGSPGEPGYQSRQQCVWAYGGTSAVGPAGDQAPNEFHVGFAASHCFLFEAAHQCNGNGHTQTGEGTHDKHGGAIYADICATENNESKYCDDGRTDTQVGLTIMDHNPCGTVVPIVACTDEYHVIRPLDQGYTTEQMEDSQEYIGRIGDDPILYLCGYPQYGGNPVCP